MASQKASSLSLACGSGSSANLQDHTWRAMRRPASPSSLRADMHGPQTPAVLQARAPSGAREAADGGVGGHWSPCRLTGEGRDRVVRPCGSAELQLPIWAAGDAVDEELLSQSIR